MRLFIELFSQVSDVAHGPLVIYMYLQEVSSLTVSSVENAPKRLLIIVFSEKSLITVHVWPLISHHIGVL